MTLRRNHVNAQMAYAGPRVNVAGQAAGRAETEEEMPRNPAYLWSDPEYAEEGLEKLRKNYAITLSVQRKSPETVRAYGHALASLAASVAAHGEPCVLGSVTPAAVLRWVKDLQDAGKSRNTVSAWLAAVKAFTRGYVYLQLELTTDDLLRTVRRVKAEETPTPMLTDDEIDDIDGSFGVGYDGVRNRAFVYCLLSTGARFREVLGMTLPGLDRVSGEFTVRAKGGKALPKRLSPRALKAVKAYLHVRPRAAADALWLRADGVPLSYWGGQEAMRKVRRESGVVRFRAHLCRHTFGQTAVNRHAHPGLVQDMLGHASPAHTKRYTRLAAEQAAASQMPRYSPV